MLLTGCVLLEGPTPNTPERTVPPQPEAAPEFVPGGTAEENLPIFIETVREFADGDQPVQGELLVNAIAAVGFQKGDMQVTHDQSKMNLPADLLFVAVRIDNECLIGQVVPDTREFAAELMDAVGPEQNVCIIGDTREITW